MRLLGNDVRGQEARVDEVRRRKGWRLERGGRVVVRSLVVVVVMRRREGAVSAGAWPEQVVGWQRICRIQLIHCEGALVGHRSAGRLVLRREVDRRWRERLTAVLCWHLAAELCRRRHLLLAVSRNDRVRRLHSWRRESADIGRSDRVQSRLRGFLHGQLL